MNKKSHTSFVYLFEILFVVASVFLIANWGKIEETISPDEYWSTQIEESKREVLKEKFCIRNLEISLEKETRLLDLDLERASLEAEAYEKDPSSSKQKVLDNYQLKIASLHSQIDLKKEELTLAEKKLHKAKKELQKHTLLSSR